MLNFRFRLSRVLGFLLATRWGYAIVLFSKAVHQVLSLRSHRVEMVLIVIKGCCCELKTRTQKESYIRSFARE